MDAVAAFHPIVRRWFEERYAAPTAAQEQGWPAIARGRHTLISAPTGSGKTLAAFLTCVDGLVRQGLSEGLPDATQVVYVSPLKALSNDIQRNLSEPLAEMTALASEMGSPLPEIRAAVRTGDTMASERQAMARRPPHILITTPESLFILLTSESGRRGLAGVRTLILDEVHAVVGSKRGAHLSLSAERLCALAKGPVTRIGLSATQRPIEEVARFLVGTAEISEEGAPNCLVVETGHRREMDLSVETPAERELGPIATHELWDEVLDRVAALGNEHRTTLVFVNTRRLVERVAHQLSERLGEEAVAAHHGSLSRRTRFAVEQRLKRGELRICVATASLELGIDIGAIDLVCQIGSPRSIGLMLQRVGRSGHAVEATPKGRLLPLTRDELLECLALVRAYRGGNLDRLRIPDWPLDVLAQQMVAACAAGEWEEEALYALCRRAYPYRDLPRSKYEQVVEQLSQGVAPVRGRWGAYLHRDGVHAVLRPRRGARLAAMTSGGAIPDTADYDVVADPEGVHVGTVNEDFAIESMAGDVFLLGNTPWRIRRIEQGRVRVQDAHGAAPTIPFWLGEAPGRTSELSDEVSALREAVDERLQDPAAAAAWLRQETGAAPEDAEQAVAYIEEGVRVLGHVPTRRRIVAERFFDEAGGMQLVIHAPFGAAINRAWGLALRKRLCRTFDFELQAAATDDGIVISLGPQHSFPLEQVFRFLNSRTVEGVLLQAALQSPFFTTRWRWNATRSLAVLRHTGGRKVPAPLQRMRSDDLLAAVFPAQVACQDNGLRGADIEAPDHPLVFETVRDCLTEALDLAGLTEVLAAIERGDAGGLRTGDAPAVGLQPPAAQRHALRLPRRRPAGGAARQGGDAAPGTAGGGTGPGRAGLVGDRGCGRGRVAHGAGRGGAARCAADAGRPAGGLAVGRDVAGVVRGAGGRRPGGAASHGGGRRVLGGGGEGRLAGAVYPDARFEPPVSIGGDAPPEEEAVAALVRGRAECSGPFTLGQMAGWLALRESAVATALARLEGEGMLLRGQFTPGTDAEEMCDRRILARIHRATIARLRREIEPAPVALFLRFLFRWQHVHPNVPPGRGLGAAGGHRPAAGVRGGGGRVGGGASARSPGPLRPADAGPAVLRGRGGVGPLRPEEVEHQRSGHPHAAVSNGAAEPGASGGPAVAAGPEDGGRGRPERGGAGGAGLPGGARRLLPAGHSGRGGPAAVRGGGRPVAARGGGPGDGRRLRGAAGAHQRREPTRAAGQAAPAPPASTARPFESMGAPGIDGDGRGPAGGARLPASASVRGGHAGAAAPGDDGAAVADAAAGLPSGGGAGGDTRRTLRGGAGGGAVRSAGGGGVAASGAAHGGHGRADDHLRLRPAEPRGHTHAGAAGAGDAGQPDRRAGRRAGGVAAGRGGTRDGPGAGGGGAATAGGALMRLWRRMAPRRQARQGTSELVKSQAKLERS